MKFERRNDNLVAESIKLAVSVDDPYVCKRLLKIKKMDHESKERFALMNEIISYCEIKYIVQVLKNRAQLKRILRRLKRNF